MPMKEQDINDHFEQVSREIQGLRVDYGKLLQKVQTIFRIARKHMGHKEYQRFVKEVNDDDFSDLYQEIKESR